MGDVYLAQDTVLDRSIALKVLPSRTTVLPDQFRRFVAEAKAASALHHPHIATIHELRAADDIHFIVMEYVEGETLKATVTRGPLDPMAIIKLATQIAGALDAAHSAGLVHRDIKSSNIVITPRGHAKLLDFGLAKRTVSADALSRDAICEATEPGVVMGTVSYMSPEQAFGRPLDHRSDLFSLGVVLYGDGNRTTAVFRRHSVRDDRSDCSPRSAIHRVDQPERSCGPRTDHPSMSGETTRGRIGCRAQPRSQRIFGHQRRWLSFRNTTARPVTIFRGS
jgi:serine/threonine protein kinase